MKAARLRLDRQRAAAGGADALRIGARDVSPGGRGLIHTSVAPQRRRHCNIARAISLVCLLAAPDGKNNAAICCGCCRCGRGGEADLHGAEWRESKCYKLFVASSFVFSYLALSL